MNIVGIIAEYNPFHLGHKYHIDTAKRLADADYAVAIISGSFVQRGCCAIADKYTRARSALLGGADLVLELPVLFATSSAETFARGAVYTLNKLGVISYLAFGSESEDIHSIERLAEILATEPESYRQALRTALSQGLPFPQARELALKKTQPTIHGSLPLNQPNTILGIEYCKALYQCKSSIEPLLIKRQGGAYHQTEQDILFSSASSIRTQLEASELNIRHSFHQPASDSRAFPWSNPDMLQQIKSQLPEESFRSLKEGLCYSFPVFDEDMSAMMRFALLNVPNYDYTPYLDINEDLSNRIKKQLFAYESFHQFAALLKTKELTYSRICRCLIHILLGITDEYLNKAKATDYVPYFRVLAMKASAAKLLGHIKKSSSIPIITNPADYLNLSTDKVLRQTPSGSPSKSYDIPEEVSTPKLTHEALALLELDCRATHIWNSIAGEKFNHKTECEYTRRFLKI